MFVFCQGLIYCSGPRFLVSSEPDGYRQYSAANLSEGNGWPVNKSSVSSKCLRNIYRKTIHNTWITQVRKYLRKSYLQWGLMTCLQLLSRTIHQCNQGGCWQWTSQTTEKVMWKIKYCTLDRKIWRVCFNLWSMNRCKKSLSIICLTSTITVCTYTSCNNICNVLVTTLNICIWCHQSYLSCWILIVNCMCSVTKATLK